MSNNEKKECIISICLHNGIKVEKADTIIDEIFSDCDESVDNTYFIARLQRWITIFESAIRFVETH